MVNLWSSTHSHFSPVRNEFCSLSGLQTASVVLAPTSKVDLLLCATVIVSSFGQIEQGVHYIKNLDLFDEESISGESSGRAIGL